MQKLKVVAGIILKDERILIMQRKKTMKFGSKWEFPGGKLEAGETPEQALIRELMEELSIKIEPVRQYSVNSYQDTDRIIELIGYIANYVSGKLKLTDHENFKWITLNEIDNFDFAPADMAIVAKLKKDGVLLKFGITKY